MKKQLPISKKVVTIGQAASILGVSIDTIRRWDKQGILKSSRPDGKNRYFSVEELEKIKFSKPLSISEAAKKLGVSQTTLRRLEKKGLIKPERNANKERVYDHKSLESFLHSQYFVKQKEVEEKVLEPLATQEEEDEKLPSETHTKVIDSLVGEGHEHIQKLLLFRRAFYTSGLFLVTTVILGVSAITFFFLVAPKQTAKFFGYAPASNKLAFVPSADKSNVLGAQYPLTPKKQSGSVLGAALKPFTAVSLSIVKQISPATYEQIVPTPQIADVNDVLGIDKNGKVYFKYTFNAPDSSYLEVNNNPVISQNDQGEIGGLQIPAGAIEPSAVTGGLGGSIAQNTVTTLNIANGTITSDDIKNLGITD